MVVALQPGRLPVDALKLDRSFVRQMGEQPQARRIVDRRARPRPLDGPGGRRRGDRGRGAGGDARRARLRDRPGPRVLARARPRSRWRRCSPATCRAPAERIRVYLCDDAPELRALLRAFLEWGGDVEIVGEAEDGDGLAEAVREAEADVVLLDLSMPRVDGLEALADLRADDPALGIVVLSGFEPSRMAAKALALGADRYLEKAAGMEDVRATVRAVAAGRRGPGALLEAVA